MGTGVLVGVGVGKGVGVGVGVGLGTGEGVTVGVGTGVCVGSGVGVGAGAEHPAAIIVRMRSVTVARSIRNPLATRTGYLSQSPGSVRESCKGARGQSLLRLTRIDNRRNHVTVTGRTISESAGCVKCTIAFALTLLSPSCNIMRSLGERHSPLVTYCLWAAGGDSVP